jgi:hypothetical protein
MVFCKSLPIFNWGCSLLWSFFGICHGKGARDGAGAMLKRFI